MGGADLGRKAKAGVDRRGWARAARARPRAVRVLFDDRLLHDLQTCFEGGSGADSVCLAGGLNSDVSEHTEQWRVRASYGSGQLGSEGNAHQTAIRANREHGVCPTAAAHAGQDAQGPAAIQ